MLAEQERDGRKCAVLNVWLGRKCLQKECKDPKESIKFGIPTMHCQCGRPNYTVIIASNPKCRPALLKFVPGEDMQYLFSEIFACYKLLF